MAKNQPKTPTATIARVLLDLPTHGAKHGELLEADPEVIAALVADGSVDAHPDAVAYAKAEGAAVVKFQPQADEAAVPEAPAPEAPAPAPSEPEAPAA